MRVRVADSRPVTWWGRVPGRGRSADTCRRSTAAGVVVAALLTGGLVVTPAHAQTAGAPAGIETTQPGSDTTRRNWVADSGLRAPLRQRWRVNFDKKVGPPVVGDGRVYVPLPDAVVALDLATGKQLWVSPGAAATVSYARGRVVAAGSGIRAIDAASGAAAWSAVLDPGESGGDHVLVTDGLVVAQGQRLRAYDLGSGALRWTGGVEDGTDGEPAAAGDKIFELAACTVAAVSRSTGAVLWKVNGGCSGGGGGRVLLDGERVLGGPRLPPLRTSDGAGLPGTAEPRVLAGGVGLRTADHGLQAFDALTGAVRWTAPEPDLFETFDEPLVIGDTVVRAHISGDLRLRRLSDGLETWAGNIGKPTDVFTGSQDQDADLAAGTGTVVVGRNGTVQALESAPAGSAGRVPVTRRTRATLSESGTRERFAGRIRSTIVSPLRLEIDEHPFGGGFRPTGRSVVPDAKGRFSLPTTVRGNVRVRVVESGGLHGPSSTTTVYVQPRIRFSARNVNNRVTARLTVSGSPRVRFRGRRVAVYHVRVRSKTLVRIATARISGPRFRTGRATVRFAALRAFGRRDSVIACVVGGTRLGQGPPVGYLARCGRSRIGY
ncbi:PQQ-binding-like beta-propeller repeat protein [Patulibacter minatonensis]|uniref:outer membrane protein assembly factor BamB family protein n=1 Tax=Patulibacter minatonensis TaxID=298163 RepID=UPI00146FA83C|nr:PQQ-binding-like beta-propeller repeat protein [Patulibacter minatonensis]